MTAAAKRLALFQNLLQPQQDTTSTTASDDFEVFRQLCFFGRKWREIESREE